MTLGKSLALIYKMRAVVGIKGDHVYKASVTSRNFAVAIIYNGDTKVSVLGLL